MSGHCWKFSLSSETAWREIYVACERAQKSIDLEQFVFGYPGRVEQEFIDLFLKKSQEGVHIRLLLDAVGSFSFYRSLGWEKLIAAGVKINYHFAILPPPLKRVFPFVLRDHRKLVIIDQKQAHIGGVIIEERARNWRDTFVSIEGDVVKDMVEAFEKAWDRTMKNRAVGQVKSKNMRKDFYIVGNSFHLHDKDLYRAILRAITAAKRSIHITIPYFFPTKELIRALSFARAKGVEIIFLFPRQSDSRLADFFSRFFYKNLRKRGMRIYLYEKAILHAKTMIVDGNWATMGSCNLDLLSLWLNYELNLVSTNPAFVKELEQHFFDDLNSATELP